MVKGVTKCVDGVRKAIDKPAPVDQKVADGCNKAIDKITAARNSSLTKC